MRWLRPRLDPVRARIPDAFFSLGGGPPEQGRGHSHTRVTQVGPPFTPLMDVSEVVPLIPFLCTCDTITYFLSPPLTLRLKVLRLAVKDIRSCLPGGTLLGAVAYADTFIEVSASGRMTVEGRLGTDELIVDGNGKRAL